MAGWGWAGSRFVRNPYYGPLWGQSTLAVLIYTFALAGALLPATLLLASAGVLYLLYALALRQDWRKGEFWLIMAASAIAFLLALSNSTGMRFFAWDEFSHWGLQLKYLAVTHSLQTDSLDLMFPDYVPGLSLYRYIGSAFGLPLESGGSLLNWYLVYMCLIALLTGTADGTRGTARLATPAILIMGFFGYFLFFQGLTATMYVDPLQSLLLLACFVAAPQVWHGRNPFLSIAPLLITIVLAKHVGIVLACMAIGLCFVLCYAESGRLRARDVKLGGALLAACVLYFLTWKLYAMAYGLDPAYRLDAGKLFAQGTDIAAFLMDNMAGVLGGAFPHAQFFGVRLVDFDPGVRHLWQALAGAGVLALAMLAACGARVRRTYGMALAYLALCLLAYLVFLSAVRGLSNWQADVWSFSRYYSTLLFASLFFLLIYAVRRAAAWKTAWALAAVTVATCTVVTPGVDELFRLTPRQPPAVRVAADKLADEASQKIPAGAMAWHIYDADDGMLYFLNRYTLYPIRLMGIAHSWRFFSVDALREPMSDANSIRAFAETLKLTDYVITDHPNPEFWARYGSFFPDRDHHVYRVVHAKDGGVLLEGM